MSGINFSNQQQSKAIQFIDNALVHDRKREVYDEQDENHSLYASQLSAFELDLREIQSKNASDRQDLQMLVQKKQQTKNQCERIINTKKPVPTEKCPKPYLTLTPKDFKEEIKQPAATQSTLPEKQEYIKIDTLPLHLILMFEQTGRTAMLNSREYIESALGDFLPKVRPSKTTLITFNDHEYKHEAITKLGINLPPLQKQGMFLFKSYNKSRPDYSKMLENIMPILQNENKANVKSIALLLTQGLKDPIDLPRAIQLQQIDPNFKMFMLGLRPAGKDYNLQFWENFATSINGSSRNEVTNTDFYELANSEESVMTALTKFQKAIAIERSIPLTQSEPKLQSLRKSLSSVAARENKVQTTINKNRNLIVQSKINMSKHKEASQDQMQISALKSLETNMNELTHKIDEYQKRITQNEDQETILKEKISEMSNLVHKQQIIFKEFLLGQEQHGELTETQKQALEQVKHAIEDYSAQKINVTEHMTRLKSTLLMIENLSTSDDSTNLRIQTQNQLHDILSLVQ